MSDRRVVSRERGEKIASDHGISFMETSAKADINIDNAFRELAEAILCKVFFYFTFYLSQSCSVDARKEFLHQRSAQSSTTAPV